MAKSAPIREPEFDPDLADIRHIIDIGLDVQESTRGPRTRDGWFAANLGYCLRRQFFERAGVPSSKGSQRSRTLWVGRALEASLISRLRHAGLLLADNVHLVDEEASCSGYVDFIWGGDPVELEAEEGEYSEQWLAFLNGYREEIRVRYGDAGELPLPITSVELKTANQYSAEKMVSEGPMFHHKMQGAFYKKVAAEHPDQLPEGIDRIDRHQLVVLAKSDAKMLVFDILDSHVEQVTERLAALNRAWPESIPACTCGRTITWERRYCPYKGPSEETCCDQNLLLDAPDSYWDLLEGEDEGPTEGKEETA